jgi:hypothetical protein
MLEKLWKDIGFKEKPFRDISLSLPFFLYAGLSHKHLVGNDINEGRTKM